jgi:hypothetical protein
MFFAVKLKSGDENHHLILDATTYTEAEMMGHQIAEVICSSSFDVPLIVKTPYREIIESSTMTKPEDAKFFKGKIAIKEELPSGKTKLVKSSILVKTETIKDAFAELNAYCKSFVSDVDIMAVEVTDITENYDKKAIEELVSVSSET